MVSTFYLQAVVREKAELAKEVERLRKEAEQHKVELSRLAKAEVKEKGKAEELAKEVVEVREYFEAEGKRYKLQHSDDTKTIERLEEENARLVKEKDVATRHLKMVEVALRGLSLWPHLS